MSGRPKRYTNLIHSLDDGKLYSSAMIARRSGFGKKGKLRVRITMARYATKHEFPHEGDGFITLKGQAPTPAWFGWRWKDTYGRED
jgi:hypothetical protein